MFRSGRGSAPGGSSGPPAGAAGPPRRSAGTSTSPLPSAKPLSATLRTGTRPEGSGRVRAPRPRGRSAARRRERRARGSGGGSRRPPGSSRGAPALRRGPRPPRSRRPEKTPIPRPPRAPRANVRARGRAPVRPRGARRAPSRRSRCLSTGPVTNTRSAPRSATSSSALSRMDGPSSRPAGKVPTGPAPRRVVPPGAPDRGKLRSVGREQGDLRSFGETEAGEEPPFGAAAEHGHRSKAGTAGAGGAGRLAIASVNASNSVVLTRARLAPSSFLIRTAWRPPPPRPNHPVVSPRRRRGRREWR